MFLLLVLLILKETKTFNYVNQTLKLFHGQVNPGLKTKLVEDFGIIAHLDSRALRTSSERKIIVVGPLFRIIFVKGLSSNFPKTHSINNQKLTKLTEYVSYDIFQSEPIREDEKIALIFSMKFDLEDSTQSNEYTNIVMERLKVDISLEAGLIKSEGDKNRPLIYLSDDIRIKISFEISGELIEIDLEACENEGPKIEFETLQKTEGSVRKTPCYKRTWFVVLVTAAAVIAIIMFFIIGTAVYIWVTFFKVRKRTSKR